MSSRGPEGPVAICEAVSHLFTVQIATGGSAPAVREAALAMTFESTELK
jgi:hypothetical protein